MKRYAKQLVLRTARSAGAFGMLAASNWRKQRLLILAYHGVSLADEHEWNPYLFITPKQLQDRLDALRHGGYSIIGLGEALQRLEKGTLSGRSVALTFDDGFSARHGDTGSPASRRQANHHRPARPGERRRAGRGRWQGAGRQGRGS